MIKRVAVKGYKSFSDLEVSPSPLTVLFGPNSAGKSNFLDALQLLSRIVTSRTLKEAFDPPYRGRPLESFSFGEKGVKGLLECGSASFSIEVDVALSENVIRNVNKQIVDMRQPRDSGSDRTIRQKIVEVREKFLRYRIEIEILPESGILRVSDEYLAALNSRGGESKARSPFIEQVDHRLHVRMEGQAHPTYYDRFLDHSIVSMPLYPPHYPHLTALKQELGNWYFFYFEPRERMRAVNSVKETRHIGLMGEELSSFLNTLKALDIRQFNAVEKALHLLIPSISAIDVSVNETGEVELKLIEGNRPISARIVSEGTLRILGLLALGGAKEPPALIGFEEPENGIHPRRIEMIAELLKTRTRKGETQLIVTTHSPILTDIIPNASLFVCNKSEAKTTIKPFADYGPIFRESQIETALDEEDTQSLPVSARILRGDFDA